MVLVVAGSLEAVWAVALGKAEGFTRLVPTLVFLVAIGASMAGLAYALHTLPTGTARGVQATTEQPSMVTGLDHRTEDA